MSVTYACRHGAGEFALPADGLPDVLAPAGTTALEADRVTLESERARAAEAFLLDNHTARVISFPLTGVDLPTRCWFALAGGDGPDAASRDRGVIRAQRGGD